MRSCPACVFHCSMMHKMTEVNNVCLESDFLRDNTFRASVPQCQAGERQLWVRESQFHPWSLLASLALAQGERETQRNGERKCPERISTDLHFICRFFPLFLFSPSLIFPEPHNCDVMTKASVIKSQTGQDEALLKTGRQ